MTDPPAVLLLAFFSSCMQDGLRQQADLRFGLLPFDATWPREKLPVIATQNSHDMDMAWGTAGCYYRTTQWLSPTIEGIPMGFGDVRATRAC